MFRMATHSEPDDFIVATGETHTVREFLAAAFEVAGIGDWQQYVSFDADLRRPVDTELMVGDATKAQTVLGWLPTMTFAEVVGAMVRHDIAAP